MNTLLLGAPPSWSYKPIPFQENKLAAGLTELCTSTTVLKYWEGIAPFYLNDMFIPSPKTWKKLTSNIKTVANTAPFMHRLKKEILSKLQFY